MQLMEQMSNVRPLIVLSHVYHSQSNCCYKEASLQNELNIKNYFIVVVLQAQNIIHTCTLLF